MRHLITLIETLLFPEDDPKNLPIFQDMLTRVDHAAIRRWALKNDWEERDLQDDFLNVFNYWLKDEHTIEVRDGIVEFYRLTYSNTSAIIGDNPVLLYHFTSSARLPSIRKVGLVSGKRSMNRRETDGVFLTTETSGPAITGYIRNALRGTTRAYGVRLSVRTTLADVAYDPDDADIASGATQFITDQINPSQIIAVDRA